jgi:hypothetical protein
MAPVWLSAMRSIPSALCISRSELIEDPQTSASVELGPGLTINKQSIGAALYASGFTGVDGILG